MNFTDRQLLDFLDSKNPSSDLWVLRESTTGRGMRLHHISKNQLKELDLEDLGAKTAREAIENYMRKHCS